MKFEEVLNQAIALIERQRRVSYRALARQFELDESYLDDLKTEIVDVLGLAVDEGGKMLVWAGTEQPRMSVSSQSVSPSPLPVTPAQPVPVVSPATMAPQARQAERRQLTVMFCDLVDSTAMSARLDPEDLREVVRAYQTHAASVLARFDGHIAQYLGDGILVYFGYPIAHEDCAWRALQSGLDIVTGLDQINPSLMSRYGVVVSVRIGVHTGQVVIGEMGASGRHENLALGEAPNIAARIQSLAQPNTVFASEATMQLASGRFQSMAVGTPVLKGITQPIGIQQVLAAVEKWNFRSGAGTTRQTVLVGRKSETLLLQARWTQAHEGCGQAVVLSGEPGTGKSRLVDSVRAQALADGAICIEWQCAAHYSSNALYPIIHLMEEVLEFNRSDSPSTKYTKIEQLLSKYRFANINSARLLAGLLSVDLPVSMKAMPHNPQQDKQQTLELICDWLVELSSRKPVLLAVEDLHWADPSTIELLGLVLDQVPTSAVLAILSCRPEFQSPWAPRQHLSFLTLDRLTKAQTESMIHELLGGAKIPAEVVQQIVAKTDGIPLFVEELVKMLLGSELLSEQPNGYGLRGPLRPLAIPATLQDSLMARLDRLSSTRETVQLAATIGREFSLELIRAVSPLDEDTLRLALAQLVKAELIYRRGSSANIVYSFKHAMILDAAYQSLLKSRRQAYHDKIASVLVNNFETIRATQPELIAHHYTEAGQLGAAVNYWKKAGQRAIERSANAEAIASLSRGLELLERMPAGLTREQSELDLRVAIGVPLVATKGYAAAEVERTYQRAHELCLQVQESPQLPNILWGLWVFYLTGGPLDTALNIAEQYQKLAESRQEIPLLLETCQLIGIPSFYRGDYALARSHLARGAAMYRPDQHHTLVFEHGGADTGVAIMTHEALTLWIMGYADQARLKMAAAMACARSLNHPFTLAFALYYSAWLNKLCGQAAAVHEATSEAISICDEHGFPFWGLSSAALRSSMWTDATSAEAGLATMQMVLAAYVGAGAELCRPSFMCLMATALGASGQPEQGLALLDEALAAMDAGQERWWQAEAHRLRGELLIQRHGNLAHHENYAAEIDAAFEVALNVAQRQQARAWQLRTMVSLLRFRRHGGRPSVARERLVQVLAGFDEGLDTADFIEASALLDMGDVLVGSELLRCP
jgi:class 3 adenylate cyclase/predicted ATPase